MNDTVTALPSSAEAYQRHGWRLVPIAAGTKRPAHDNWNAQNVVLPIAPGQGIGLCHAYSGTMALDIDNWDLAAQWLAQGGISLDDLYSAPDAVVIDSGRAGHGKLLYATPMTLPSKKLMSGRSPFLEFRCGTWNGLTVQDVIPPSAHPSGTQYRWAGRGHWSRLPTIPEALIKAWVLLLEGDRARTISTGEAMAASWDEIRSALWAISPDCDRDTWIAAGMALHWAGSQSDQIDQAFDLWDEWSAGSATKYPGERELAIQWRSMRLDKMNHVTLGTLYHHARAAGWQRPMPDASALFAAVDAPAPPLSFLLNQLTPEPPDVPLDLFPAPLAAIARELSGTIGCDPLMPLVAGLGAACAVADARTRLELAPGYKVPPVLWLLTIGHPADKKSPGSVPMMRVLHELEAADRARYTAELLAWEAHEAQYNAAKKDYLTQAASPDSMLPGATLPLVPVLPAQPVPLRLTVEDVTSQKLVRHAAERPQGFLCYQDEMNSWIRKICDPRSGEDRSAWVRAYEARPYAMDRVGAGAIYAENLAVAFFGNVQPAVLKANAHHMTADGLLQRFIPFALRERFNQRGEPIPETLSCMPLWEGVLRLLFAMPAQTYTLSIEAYAAFRDFQLWYEQLKRDERLLGASEAYMQAIGKLEGTAGRLLLMFHLIESPFAPQVSLDCATRVLEIVKSYIVRSLRYTLNETSADTFPMWVRDHVIQYAGETETLTLSQIRRSARARLEDLPLWHQEMRVLDAMLELETARWVLRIEDQPHRHHVAWTINPAIRTLFADYRNERIRAKQRLFDKISSEGRGAKGTRRVTVGYDPATMD